ncbi:MAG: Sf3a2-prov protein [Rhizobiaceae bacterium]|nr:Sf3a2-prov protein [Rhizobiaceae bacterium]
MANKRRSISEVLSIPEIGMVVPIQPPGLPPDDVGNDETIESNFADDEVQAYELGAASGKADSVAVKNPYPDGSKLAKAFEHGCLDGRKIRDNDKLTQ